jgi:hypothetical protein
VKPRLVIPLIGAVLALMIFSLAILYASQEYHMRFFFDKEPFVHPKIIEDLCTWVSDEGEQVVAVNLLESMDTNRYFGDVKISGKDKPFIFYENTEECEKDPCPFGAPSFGYRLIGTTSSGIIVLFTEWSGGGSGRFRNLLLVSLEKDKGLSFNTSKNTLTLDRERCVLKRLGEIHLGDRYEGDITLEGDILRIGKDKYSPTSGIFKKDKKIVMKPIR